HAGGEISRERKLAALIGRHFGVASVRARDIGLVFDQRLVSENFAGKNKRVADLQRFDEIFLNLAEEPPAAGNKLAAAAGTHQPHFDHIRLNYGADVLSVALGNARMRNAPTAILALPDLG